MDLISALEFLKLHIIPPAWVDEVWDLEFTEKKPLDDAIEEELTASDEKAFTDLYQCLLVHTAEQQQSTDTEAVSQGEKCPYMGEGVELKKRLTLMSIWALLGENGVSGKSLVAVLSFFVLSGQSKTATVRQRVSGLHAAALYLLLLGIPGSIANKVFHEVFLDTCSNMTFHCWPQDSGKKRKKETMKSSQAENKRPRRNRKDCQEVDMDDAEEDEEEGELHFTVQDMANIRGAVVLLLQSLLRLLQTLPLKGRPQNANNCAQIFSKLLYLEPIVGELDFTAEDFTKLKSVPAMAFYGLQLLCSPKHGDQKEALRRVFHRLLYVILMMNKGNRGKPTVLTVNQAVLAIRDQAIHFICHVVDMLKELALPFLQILLQHICFQMVERSEFRSHGAQAVGMLTAQMTSPDYACFIKWLYNYSRHSKMVCRLFSVDVVMVLLEQPERSPEDCQDPDLAHFLPHKFLIQNLLFAQRNDESPIVQGHAFACLAHCLELPSVNATRAVHGLFSTSGSLTVLDGEVTEGTLSSQQTQKTYRSLPFRTVEISSAETSNGEAKENLALLLRRVQDPKTNVRKSALQALVSLLKHNVVVMSSETLSLLSERCRDPAVSVKKKALQCLGELLYAKPDCHLVQRAWLQGVVPAVVDSENSVQEKALEALDQVLLSQVKLYSAGRHLDAAQTLIWDLLDLLCHECLNLSQYFSRAFTIWSKLNRFTPAFVNNLISHTETDHAAGAWLLLSKVVASSPKLPYGKILEAWDNMVSSKDINVRTCCHILSVMGDIATHLNEDTKHRIINELMALLKTTLSLEVISAAMETLYRLGHSEDVKQTQAFLNLHCGELVSVCEAHLASIILCENGAHGLNEELMIKHLHTLGVASLHCPAKISKRTVLLVESVLTSNSDKLADFQEELPPSLPLSTFTTNCFPTRVRAHGVITLGKLCLQRDELVQKYLPVFARELEVGTEVAVRNNVVVIMCDLCVRYTNTGDHYIPNISACLRDSQPVIREQTLIMLTNLLQEEFVKWKGSLFFQFMVALVDPVPAISSLCEYCLLHLLLKKSPEMFSQHFIECIFHFNSYSKHKSYNKFPQSDKEKAQFSLKGSQNREKRFRIYRFLLEHFTDVQRFHVMSKINQSVLACFADEELPLDEDGTEILSETFSILSLKEMKLQAVSCPAAGSAGDEPEEENMATVAKAVLEAAQKKVVSQIQKKAFIENTVPLIISLKNLLEHKRSPVLRDLMAYLKVKMQDYRGEVKEFFSGDEQLAAEVEFALKMTENEQSMEEKMGRCSLTGGSQSPKTQGPVQLSAASSRPLPLLGFATPQPTRPPPLFNRLVYSARSHHSASVLHKGPDHRAISTPKGVDVHLTFNDVSPIFRDRRPSSMGETDVLHVKSKQQQAPGLRRWNVQSPLRPKKNTVGMKPVN